MAGESVIEKCSTCDGRGYIGAPEAAAFGKAPKCPVCDGLGEHAAMNDPLDMLREWWGYEGDDVAEGIRAVEKYVRVIERRAFGEIAAVLALHKPAPVEVELWCDDEGVTPLHDADFPDCVTGSCPGHLREIPSCVECGYDVDYDGTVNYTKWPCPTARALGVTE